MLSAGRSAGRQLFGQLHERQSWGSAITPQYPEADPDRGRRSLSPRDREKSGRTSERDRRDGDGQGRAGRAAQGQHGPVFRRELYPAAAA